MTKNRMADVRDHLCATLESLADRENPMEIGRAKAISDVAQTYINSVKVEVDARKLLGDNDVKLPAALGAPEPLKQVGGPSR